MVFEYKINKYYFGLDEPSELTHDEDAEGNDNEVQVKQHNDRKLKLMSKELHNMYNIHVYIQSEGRG